MIVDFNETTVWVLNLIVTVLLPLLVGLVTKQSWSAGAKAVLLLLLAAITGIASEALDAGMSNTPYDIQTSAVAAAQAFVIAVAVHFGLWKPTGATEAAQNSGLRDGPNRYIE